MPATAGSFALSGQAAGLSTARTMPAVAGSFTLTGQAAALKAGRKLSAVAGSFALTGNAVSFSLTRRLTAVAGSFVLTGQTAALSKGVRLSAVAGSFALTGQVAALRAARKLAAAAGAFTLTGQTVALNKGQRLAAAAGSFALTGQTAALKYGRRFAASAGSFALTGQSAVLTKGTVPSMIEFLGSTTVKTSLNGADLTIALSGATGLLDENGAQVTLLPDDIVIVGYSHSGTGDVVMGSPSSGWTLRTELNQPAGVTHRANLASLWKKMGATPDTSMTVDGNGNASDALAGAAFAWRGVNTTTPFDTADIGVTGTPGTAPNPGAITPITHGAVIGVIGGGASGTPNVIYDNPSDLNTSDEAYFRTDVATDTRRAIIGMGFKDDWTSGAFDPAAWTGGDGNGSWAAITFALRPGASTYTMAAASGAFMLTGQGAALRKGFRVPALAGSFALSGQPASFPWQHKMPAVAGAFTLTGRAATLFGGKGLSLDRGTFTLTGLDAALKVGKRLAAVAGSFSLTGNAVTFRKGKSMTAAAGAFLLTGRATIKGTVMAAAKGIFNLTGQTVRLNKGFTMYARPGYFIHYWMRGKKLTVVRTVILTDTRPAAVALAPNATVAAPGAFTPVAAPPAVTLE